MDFIKTVKRLRAEDITGIPIEDLRRLLNQQIGLRRKARDRQMEYKAITATLTTNIHNIRERIGIISPNKAPSEITDHAILRYLERVDGIDLGEIRNKLDTEELRECIARCSTGSHVINGVTYVTDRGTLVTVIYDDPSNTTNHA